MNNNIDDPTLLNNAFKIFDEDGSGSISRDELKATLASVMAGTGDMLPEDEIDEIIAEFDEDGDGAPQRPARFTPRGRPRRGPPARDATCARSPVPLVWPRRGHQLRGVCKVDDGRVAASHVRASDYCTAWTSAWTEE